MTTKELLIREIRKLPEPVLKNFYNVLLFIMEKSKKKLKKDNRRNIYKIMNDETEYLLRSPANKKKLLSAIENVRNRKSLIEVNMKANK